MLHNAIAVLLAGGVGSRLFPLTQERAKPAVPFAGKYRIIDFTLSNCYYSGLRRVLVLTQYKSHSLQKHLRDGWSIFNPSLGEYITPVPPQMRTGDSWYVGTADAVYQNKYLLDRSNADQVIILSGDHIYRMDYAAMFKTHCESGADATLACMRVPLAEASQFGVMGVNDDNRIVEFQEKPEQPRAIPDDPKHVLASMGIYIFSRQLLCELLEADHAREESSHDFGKDIIPQLIETHKVVGFRFGEGGGRVNEDGYWRDVGTIDSLYEAHMDLLKPWPPLDLYQRDWLIRTVEGQGPPARTVSGVSGIKSEIENSMLNSGTVICGGCVTKSILGRNVRIDEHAVVANSILGNGVQVGARARVRNCIVDKHVKIPQDERIGYDMESDAQRFTVSEGGITVVPRGYEFNDEPDANGGPYGRLTADGRVAAV